MVYVTGDCHANFSKFNTKNFPQQKEMTSTDVVIIAGDFGGIWHDRPEERYWLDWLESKSFTICFVDGNHENFDRLYSNEFEILDFYGGKAHRIRSNIYHLMRGYIFTFEGKKFFTFGGASSHDIVDGILDAANYETKEDFAKVYNRWSRSGKMFRVNHTSWWKEELPNMEEMDFGVSMLEQHNWEVDYVITHCLPQEVASTAGYFGADSLTMYFEQLIQNGLKFKHWYAGHYHRNERLMGKFDILYEDIVRIV